MPHSAGDTGALAWADGVDTSIATHTAGIAATIPRWAPTTFYTLGQQVISPNNDVVSAIAAHTSGGSFTAGNWTLSSTYETPASTAAKFPALSNGTNPTLGQSSMFNRLDNTGATVAGDATPKGCLEVYTQIAAMAHDLALIVHGHADLHFSHAGPSNRAQLVTITGAPTGGTFTLTYGGQTTTALAYNASGAQVQAALALLSTLVGSTVLIYSATGGAPASGGPWTISLTIADPTALTATASLTGGTAPGVTIAQTVPDGLAYFDLPIGGNIPIAGTLVGKQSTGQLVSQLGQSSGSYRWLDNTGALLMSMSNAGAFLLGSSLTMSGGADLPRFFGGGSSGGMAIHGAGATTGTSGLIRFRDNSTDNNTRFQVGTAAPATAGATTLALSYHNGTAATFQFVTVGAADSGGVGFKSLRVPN